MKLYQKIMVSIFAVLTVCGIFFGWFMGTYFENRQISRAAETELHSYETALYTLEKLYAMETEEDASEKNARMIMDSLFSHKMYRDYICLKNGQVFSDSSEYVIRFDPGWLEQGRFEETEYVIEENNGEYLMVIGTRIPWFQENGYLFTVRDLTDIHRDVRDFLGQFAMLLIVGPILDTSSVFLTLPQITGSGALAIFLRMVPRCRQEAGRIHKAQQGIGRGIGQGSVLQRIRIGLRIFSMLITWLIDHLTAASESVRSRGSSLRGKTAFSAYRFDNRDRAYVIALFTCLSMIWMAVMLRQTDMVYDPRMIWTSITSMSWLFYGGYVIFCRMPMFLDLWTEYRFRNAGRKAF
ncbi:hypothetical protein [Fusibacillus kribbianus]|uniref:Uncharacterized protein n=1 Tax=Fusibacillus kribbianus TaxID=3044208 RepID=A0AAP4F068_9FIRM|nr:hypothetical protein [Ruminococcus sp. YH-rum2234]MDI9242890.1 hypothetical protein [Ruminococcus sp. YH-rum2234]